MLTAAMKAALAMRSIRTAIVGPTRSSNAPAMGLTRRPGAIAAKVSQPASAGEEKRARTNRTRVRPNMRAARRDSVAARIRGDRPGIDIKARYEFWESMGVVPAAAAYRIEVPAAL
jgi:hypothetical protein